MNIYRVPQSTFPGIRRYNDNSFNINKLYKCNVNVLLTIHNKNVLKEQNFTYTLDLVPCRTSVNSDILDLGK